MAIAGPLTSLGLSALCLALALAAGWTVGGRPDTPVTAVLVWLGYINLVLAVFNMVPGYPLDGGRVLRAIVWAIGKDKARATRVAALSGQVVAVMLIAYGIVGAIGGAGFGALWLALIGWFLLAAAQSAYRSVELDASLREIRVGDVMSDECRRIDGRTTVREFLEEHVMRTGRRCVLVEEGGRVVGLVTPHETRAVARERWSTASVREVMRPLKEVTTIDRQATLSRALEIMAEQGLDQLPVVVDGTIAGTVSRGDVFRVVSARSELARTA
jgi:CBS domain-containing protein